MISLAGRQLMLFKSKLSLVVAPSIRTFWSVVHVSGILNLPDAVVVLHAGEVHASGRTWRYVSRPDQLRGYHNVEIEFWGNCSNIPFYDEFVDLARYIEAVRDDDL